MNNPFDESERPTDDIASSRLRAAHLLMMATRLIGTTDQVRALGADGRILGVPVVRRRSVDDEHEALDTEREEARHLTQERLDEATGEILFRLGIDRRWEGAPDPGHESRLWSWVRETRSRSATYALLNIAARSEEPLPSVAAAAALAQISGDTSELALSTIERYSAARDPEIAEIALVAARRRDEYELIAMSPPEIEPTLRLPSNAAADEVRPSPATPPVGPTALSTCVHGTWSRHSSQRWYTPRGRLFRHIRTCATPSLYDGSDYFRWTGGYSDGSRRMAAVDLSAWRSGRGAAEFDTIYAHSHGGNVALNAAESGEAIHLLVLLHTPITSRTDSQWREISRNIGRIYTMRTRGDLVMLIDGIRTGSSLDLPKNVFPRGPVKPHWVDPGAYFSHDYYLREEVWEKHGIASDIVFERGLADWRNFPARDGKVPL